MARTEGVIFWPLPRFSFPSAHTKSSTRDRFPWWLRKEKKKKTQKIYLLEFLELRSRPRSGMLCWKGCAQAWSRGC